MKVSLFLYKLVKKIHNHIQKIYEISLIGFKICIWTFSYAVLSCVMNTLRYINNAGLISDLHLLKSSTNYRGEVLFREPSFHLTFFVHFI